MDTVLHNSPETNAIRQRMQEVRCDLDEDVQDIVEGARDLSKWRSYVRSYPWVCLGTALAVGYWIAPRRSSPMQPHAQTPAELENPSRSLLPSHLPPKGNARGVLRAFVGNLVLRGVASFVEQQAGRLFATQAASRQEDEHHEEPHS